MKACKTEAFAVIVGHRTHGLQRMCDQEPRNICVSRKSCFSVKLVPSIYRAHCSLASDRFIFYYYSNTARVFTGFVFLGGSLTMSILSYILRRER